MGCGLSSIFLIKGVLFFGYSLTCHYDNPLMIAWRFLVWFVIIGAFSIFRICFSGLLGERPSGFLSVVLKNWGFSVGFFHLHSINDILLFFLIPSCWGVLIVCFVLAVSHMVTFCTGAAFLFLLNLCICQHWEDSNFPIILQSVLA